MPRASFWPSAILTGGDVLGKAHRRATFRTKVDHLGARNFVLKPDSTMRGAWKLRVKINGPSRSTAPAAYVVVRRKSAGVTKRPIPLSRSGAGKVVVTFDNRRTQSVLVTVANTSTRFTCRRGTSYSCRGVPKDDNRRFSVTTKAFR